MTESERHKNYKHMVATMLQELKEKGMDIKGIQEEKERRVNKYTNTIKCFRKFGIVSVDEHCEKSSLPYIFYLVWTDDIIHADDIFLNLIGHPHINIDNKHVLKYDTLQKDFTVIEFSSDYRTFNSEKNDPIKLNFTTNNKRNNLITNDQVPIFRTL